jgi:uncharacterized MnhB-related membrane protein
MVLPEVAIANTSVGGCIKTFLLLLLLLLLSMGLLGVAGAKHLGWR